jgi:hypothetical protein
MRDTCDTDKAKAVRKDGSIGPFLNIDDNISWKTRDEWAYLLIADRSVCSSSILGRYELIETIPKLSKLGFPCVHLIEHILNVHPAV